MTNLRAAEVTLTVILATVCYVAGFTTSPVGNVAGGLVSHCSYCTSTSAVQPRHLSTREQNRSQGPEALKASAEGGEDDGIEEYKKQMADFMAKAHDKRLQAMEAVKVEVQRGYEEQIADLQAKLSALPATSASADSVAAPARVAEPALVASGAGASASGPPHPAYAARAARAGWESRWGSEEAARASSVTAADISSMEARAKGVASSGETIHPAYAARSQRPGWEARWGDEEAARAGTAGSLGVQEDVHPAYDARTRRPGWEARWGDEEAARAGSSSSAGAQKDVHPAYAARAQRPGWEARWGDEEMARAGNLGAADAQKDVHPAYAARAQRPGWESRWGDEETARAGGAVSVGAQANVHPAYAARAQRPGWEARWGSEEPARMEASATSAALSPEASAQGQAAAAPTDFNPAYSARLQRPGWEGRWGSEEKERVTGAPAGELAVAGAAAGFAMAGGLDARVEDAAAGVSFAAQLGSEDPLSDDYLPDDVSELKSMVVSYREHFQKYLMRSLEASNELRDSKAKVDADLSSSTVKLNAERDLRESLQESFLGYMSRSGDAGANGKARVGQLEGEVVRLAAEAEELQRFTQEYMVKASSDKQKAIEEATSNALAQSAERIAALQAHVLELQAGG